MGLLALKMCLLDSPHKIFEYSSLSKSFILHKDTLDIQLSQLTTRYSADLANLLRAMLKINPEERVDYAQLIDFINPVLISNLQRIKQLHSPVNIKPQE